MSRWAGTGQGALAPGPVPSAVKAALGDDRLARAAWSRLAEPGDTAATRLVAEVGAPLALEAVVTGRGPERWRTRLADLDPASDVAAVRAAGGRVLVPGDDEWPTGLGDLDVDAGGDGPLGAPFCLWVRGPVHVADVCARSAALVGSRAATGYGRHVAAELAAGVADRGFAVVSGGAFGIDAAAHRAALAVEGVSVAVLACGVDRSYPAGNAALLAELARTGALVSEVPPGTTPTRWRFLERNRLIAALTRGTVVVEAAWRSGALSTADRAERLLRPVGAVPGPVTSAASAGCHRLLRERGAVCVTSAEEVVELVGELDGRALPVPVVQTRPFDGLDRDELRVAECLPRRGACGLDRLARDAGLAAGTVQAVLGRLELSGHAVRHDGGWRRGTVA
ncbi:DNA-processing protein DprA [Kineococcus rhizosphaerae]|uniref:DNA protecting protein DprA n=1 Tax=Kineococcus rhizosphaerae TaxID=559628 RepID=A0A2T0RBP5_9ACTN|nr:DNA-processing protein DprA [Kineococcus rhizosphaerae]PRY18596.1 DNA protecting protein DprA [Kineococcus rhizosphaerae]